MKTLRIFLLLAVTAMTVTFFTSCGDDALPAIGGYNSADEVGKSNLVAYWPMDGSGVEKISNTSPSKVTGVTFSTGAKGQAANLTEGYLSYPAISTLNSMTNATVSAWVKLSNNGSFPSLVFQMTRALDATHDEWAGNINLMAETGWRKATSDSITVKGLVVIKKADGSANWQDIVNSVNPSAADIAAGSVAAPNKIGGSWAQLVWAWDSAKGAHYLYVNGTKISDPRWEVRNGNSELALNFFSPTRPLIGTFASVLTGNGESWQKSMTGSIDELRVWNKTLGSSDIGALYELEKAGR